MKTKNAFDRVAIAVTQSKWTRPAVIALAILATVFVVTGCDRSNDASDHGNHGNHGNHMGN